MFYVDTKFRRYFKEDKEGRVAVDDAFENAPDYGVTQDDLIVDAWNHNGISFSLDSGEE